jgi:ABC-type maltose transport system permease subunit
MQVCKQKQACIPKMKEKNKWREIFKNYMHKENFGNHMEDYLCVGVFTMSMIM